MHLKIYLPILLALALFFSAFKGNPTTTQQDAGFLKNGENAPTFVTKDVLGNKVHLKKMLKNSNVLLTFLRPAWCPICNARTHELIESYEEMKKQGYEIIAVYPSTSEELKGYVKDLNIPFTVIADPEEELYRLYKVERSKDKFERTLKEEKALKAIDRGKKLYEKHGNDYGGLQNVEEPIIPADFVLNKGEQKIQTAYYGAYIGDHMNIRDMQNDKAAKGGSARF